jgi:hypothetical protein
MSDTIASPASSNTPTGSPTGSSGSGSSGASMISSSSHGLPQPLADTLEQFRDKLMEQRDLG